MAVNEVLQGNIQMRDFHIEFNPISIEFIVVGIQEIMSFLLEVFNNLFEFLSQTLHPFKIMLLKSLELLDVGEDINQFLESSNECIEFPEELGFREIECFAFGHVGHLLFRLLVALLILPIQLDALSKHFNELGWISLPNVFNLAIIEDFLFAVFDHLVSDLDEEPSHLVVGIVEPCYGVNHLDRIH